MNKKHYYKRIINRKLNNFQEYKTVTYSSGASFIIFLIVLLSAFDLSSKAFDISNLIISSIFLVSGLIQLLIALRVKKEIINDDEIRKTTRLLSIPLIILGFTGNIFSSIAGFTLMRKQRTMEYTLCVYSIMITFSILAISILNIFKDYVANGFFLGIGLLLGFMLFYIIMMFMISKHVRNKKIDKIMIPFAIISLFGVLFGNIFSFVMGVMILHKYHHKDNEITIEWINIIRRLFRNYMAVLGIFVVVLLISLSIFSNLTFDYGLAIDNDYSALLQSPSLEYPFGTDNFGRCVFTRIVFGARISLLVGLIATAIPIVIGGILGALAGYYGRRTDNTIMRILDILYAIPGILLAIAIVAAFGANTLNLILALSIGAIPMYARTVRASVMSLANQEFVEAAKACGARDITIIFKHIIPNSLAPVIVRATLGIGGVVLSTSSLSYLGLGVEPHIPEWGNILKVGSNYLETNPYLAIFPGLAIILIVLAFNYFGDGLRDALDPKLK